MKKYIPYVVILLLTYLAFGFINMEFNPKYWKQNERGMLIFLYLGASFIYSIIKVVKKDNESWKQN
jgi:hypothetical protein